MRHAIFYLCRGGSSRDELLQGEGVFNGKAISIIVEIDEDRFSVLFPGTNFSSPLVQLPVRIIRTVEGFTPMEAKIDEL